jgi:hypothetical protein
MKKRIILHVLLFTWMILYSQNYQLTWQQCYGGSNGDLSKDIVETTNGYLITGGTSSNDGDISFYHGAGDGWLIRVDSVGNILWEKTFGGSDLEYFNKIISIVDNNFYLLGLSFSSDGDISNDPYPDSPDYWIVKIDSSGNIIWDKILGGTAGENLWNGAATANGGVVAIGETSSNDGDVSIYYGGNETWLVKLSSEGELEWDYTIGTDFFDIGQAIIQTTDGGFLAASNSILLEGGSGNITCIPHSYGWVEGVLVKLDSNLNIQWQRCYGGSDHDGISGIIEITDGYVFVGSASSNDGDVSGNHGGIDDFWVVRVDFEGNIIWQNPLGGSKGEAGCNIIVNDSGDFHAIGSTYSNDGDVYGNHSLTEYYADIWLVKLNHEGDLLYQQCFGGEGNELVEYGVVKKSDNNLVIAGHTNYGPSYDVGCTPHGGNWSDKDYWVFVIDSLDTTGLIEKHYDKGLVEVYPNPAGDYVEFNLTPPCPPQGGSCTVIKISDVLGEEVAKLPVINEKTIWDCREGENGIYFYSVGINSKWYSGKLVKSGK